MDVKLTKEADQVLAMLYQQYLSKRKEGKSKYDSRRNDTDHLESLAPFNSWPSGDFSDALCELARKDLIKLYISGDCELLDDTIALLEDRFTDGLLSLSKYFAEFIIPTVLPSK